MISGLVATDRVGLFYALGHGGNMVGIEGNCAAKTVYDRWILAFGRDSQAVLSRRRAVPMETDPGCVWSIKPMAKNKHKAAQCYRKGVEAIKIENFGVAKGMLTKAYELDKDNPDIMMKLGQVLVASGYTQEAVEVLRRCIKRKPNFPDSLLLLSQAYMGLGRIEDMHATLDKALAWDPTHGACLHAKVIGYINAGELELASEVLDRAKGIDDPHPLILLSQAKLARAKKEYSIGVDAANALLEHPRALDRHKRSARFELGHLHDAMGEYDQAFAFFKLANSGHIHGKVLHADSIISMWTPEMLKAIPESTIETQRPVFIVGMPRTGTTLTEQILIAHPLVGGVGECPQMMQMLRRRSPTSLSIAEVDAYAREYIELCDGNVDAGITRVIDKHIGAERTLGLISRLFPNAKVIHCQRDPVDTCLSSYFQNFGTNVPYSRDLAQLGKHFVAYQRVMAHWYEVLEIEILPNPYEELVADPEPRSRALVAHVGLEFDQRCLRFHESRAHVSTASSVQVRSPIYQSSKQRWRNYEHHLGPLIDQLGEFAQGARPFVSKHGA